MTTRRLPIPGQDDGTWGDILNDFLSVEHNADGTLKASGSLVTKIDAGILAAVATSGSYHDLTDKPAYAPIRMMDVKLFGARGDGVSDDTSAINAAIAAASTGGTVFFPNGTYVISGSLIINTDNIRLLGVGYGSLIKAAPAFPATGIPMIWVKGSGGSNYRYGPVVEQLYIDGGGVAGVMGIQLDSTYHAQIQHCWIRYCTGIGLYLNGTSNAYGAYTNVTSTQITDGGSGKGITTNNHEHCIFTGCVFAWYNLPGGIGAQSNSSNMVFQACKFDVNDISLDLEFCTANVVQGCDFDRGRTNHLVLNGAQQTRVMGCQFSSRDGGAAGADMVAVNGGGSSLSNLFVGNVAAPGTEWNRFIHEFGGIGPGNQYIGNDPADLAIDLKSPWIGASPQSASASATASGGAITTAGLDVARVSPTVTITGVTLQPGIYGGQKVTVVNESANSITFAAASVSHVADGTSDVIAASSARRFVWNSGLNFWFRES